MQEQNGALEKSSMAKLHVRMHEMKLAVDLHVITGIPFWERRCFGITHRLQSGQ